MNIEMLKVTDKVKDFGFKEFEGAWYEKEIPQTFRGKYVLYICDKDIYGIYYGVSKKELELNQFIDKLSFRTPEAANDVINLLKSMKDAGAIDYKEIGA